MIFKKKPKIDYQAMANILPTSKYDLKMQCIAISRGNIDEAMKLYDFLASDLNIPDVTPPPPSVMQQVKDTAGSIFGFIKENQDDFVKAFSFIQSLRQGNTASAPAASTGTTLPPLNTPNV